jgi:AraC-like DNA-binding protein
MSRSKSIEAMYRRVGNRLLDGYGRDVMAIALQHGYSVVLTSAALGLKPFQLKRRVEAVIGLAPKDYFRLHRACLAKCMMLEGLPLEAISDALGFRHYTHFAAEVRAFFGCCPRDLRAIFARLTG